MDVLRRFYLFLLTLILVLSNFREVSAQLLPPFGPNSGARSSKTFKNGVVTCGDTFCDADKCLKSEQQGKVTYICNE